MARGNFDKFYQGIFYNKSYLFTLPFYRGLDIVALCLPCMV